MVEIYKIDQKRLKVCHWNRRGFAVGSEEGGWREKRNTCLTRQSARLFLLDFLLLLLLGLGTYCRIYDCGLHKVQPCLVCVLLLRVSGPSHTLPKSLRSITYPRIESHERITYCKLRHADAHGVYPVRSAKLNFLLHFSDHRGGEVHIYTGGDSEEEELSNLHVEQSCLCSSQFQG